MASTTDSARIDPAWLDADPAPQLVDGEERRDGPLHDIIDPSTGQVIGAWTEATERDIDDALRAARRTFDEGVWSRMAVARRAEVLDAIAQRIREETRTLAALEALETGKPMMGAITYDMYEAANLFAYAAGLCRDLHGSTRRTTFPPDLLPGGGPELLNLSFGEPVGVVAEMLPWNAPMFTGSERIAAALAAGCSIVAKPAEEANLSPVRLGRIALECGLPAGVLNLVLGPGETVGERLITDPRVDLVSLTGGVETGRHVVALAARNLTPVSLELGGKAPVIVFDDADIGNAIPWAMMAAFVNMGQVCISGSRLLVHEGVYDDVVNGVAAAAATLKIGDALDAETFIGPLVSERHADRVRGFRDRALANGDAEQVGDANDADLPTAAFVAPSVLGRTRPGSEIEQQEVFGPVLVAQSFSTEEEAIARANSTQYGLNATMFTRDIERAFRVADRLQCGEVDVNVHFTPLIAAGRGEPRKSSGLSKRGLEGYQVQKAINIQIRS